MIGVPTIDRPFSCNELKSSSGGRFPDHRSDHLSCSSVTETQRSICSKIPGGSNQGV